MWWKIQYQNYSLLSFTRSGCSYFEHGGASSARLPTQSSAYVFHTQIFLSPSSVLQITNLICGICFLRKVLCYTWFVIICVTRKCVSEFLGTFAKFQRRLLGSSYASVRPSVCPHGTTRLSQNVFSWNLTFKYFSKLCRENLSYIKIWQE